MTSPDRNALREEANVSGPSSLAGRLEILAFVLISVYGSGVAISLFPPKLLDPAWQINAIKVVLDNAAIALLGMGLMHLATYLAPDRIGLQRRRSGLSRLAVLAALGFLLIIPLQCHSIWKAYTITGATINRQQLNISTKAEGIRTAVNESTSPEDLKRRLQALQSPDFRINFGDFNFAALPLTQLKQQILTQLDQAEGRFKTTYRQPDQAAVEEVFRGSLTVIISAAAFAIGFAAVAQRKNSPFTFLVEIPSIPSQMLSFLWPRRGRSKLGTARRSFLKSPAKREEEFFESLAPHEEGDKR